MVLNVSDADGMQCVQNGDIMTSKKGQAQLSLDQPRGKFADLLYVVLRPNVLDGDALVMCDFNVNPLLLRLLIHLQNAGENLHNWSCHACTKVRNMFTALYVQCAILRSQ